MRVLKRVVAGFAIIVALLVLGAVVPRPLLAPEPGGAPTRRILVIANPIHTDIALPLDAGLVAAFPWLEDPAYPFADPGARWIVFGWGSRAFYIETPTWADLKPGPLFKALTIDDSVLHVVAAGDIDAAHPAVTALDLDEAGFARLVAFVAESFVAGPDGKPVAIPRAAYGDYDVFFEAQGVFNALLGCNVWTAKALRVAGFRTGWWNPLPLSLTVSLALYD